MSISQETLWWPFKPPGGGGGAPPAATPVIVPPAARRVTPGEAAEREDLMARLKKARSRALSQVAEVGLLEEMPTTTRPVLSDIL